MVGYIWVPHSAHLPCMTPDGVKANHLESLHFDGCRDSGVRYILVGYARPALPEEDCF